MSRRPLLLAACGAAAAFLVPPASADQPPPAGALPLSEALQKLESSADVAWIDDASWDDDGYWEIDYVDSSGAKIEVRLDPLTGETLQRR